MQTFRLKRVVDDPGVSGTGYVAEACEFSNGRCVVTWTGTIGTEETIVQGVAVYDSLADAKQIHGHNGYTQFEPFLESEVAEVLNKPLYRGAFVMREFDFDTADKADAFVAGVAAVNDSAVTAERSGCRVTVRYKETQAKVLEQELYGVLEQELYGRSSSI